MALVNQPTLAPQRKWWWAALIAGILVNAAYGAADFMWPGHPFEPYKGEIIGWTVVLVGSVVHYFTRERANVVDKTSGIQELDIGSGGGAATPVVRVDEEKPRQDGARKQAPKRQTRKVN
jgi:hypothetical protein